MERLANVVTTDLYNSEEVDLCLIDEPVVKRKGRPRKLVNLIEDSDSMKIPKMLMNSAKENYSYRQLVQSMKFLQIDKKELSQQFIDAYYNPESINATTTAQAKYLKSLEHDWFWCRGIDLKTKTNLILYISYYLWSYVYVASKLKTPIHSIKWVIKAFRRSTKLQRQINKINASKARRVLNNSQIEWLSDYLNRNKGKHIVARHESLLLNNIFLKLEGLLSALSLVY